MRLRPIALLAPLLACLSCATTGTGQPTGPVTSVPIQIAADCAAPAVRDEIAHIADDVASAIMSGGDWAARVDAVGQAQYQRLKDDAWPALKCAVAEVMAKATEQLAYRAAMENDAIVFTTTKHDRAAAWLAKHPAPAGSTASACRTQQINDMTLLICEEWPAPARKDDVGHGDWDIVAAAGKAVAQPAVLRQTDHAVVATVPAPYYGVPMEMTPTPTPLEHMQFDQR